MAVAFEPNGVFGPYGFNNSRNVRYCYACKQNMYFRKGRCLNPQCIRYVRFAYGPCWDLHAGNFSLGHGGGWQFGLGHGGGGGGGGGPIMHDTINIADDGVDNEDNNDNDKTDKSDTEPETEPPGLDAVACSEVEDKICEDKICDSEVEDKICDETQVTKDCDCDSATEPGDYIPELAQNNFLKEKKLNTLDVTSVDTSEFDKRETLTTTTTAATLAANYSAAELWAAIKLRGATSSKSSKSAAVQCTVQNVAA